MQDFIFSKIDILVLFPRHFIRVSMVDIIELPLFVTVYLHILREQRIQAEDVIPSIPDDLAVGIPPQKQMCHQRFPPGKAAHLIVGLPV